MATTPTDLIYTMNHQFTLYLQRCGVSRTTLPPDQLRETERAFYGGLGQMFFLVTIDAANMKRESDQSQVLESIQKQIEDYWARELAIQLKLPILCTVCGWHGTYDKLIPRVGAELPKCPECNASHGLHYDDDKNRDRVT
jgi:hypothetical protein